MVFLLISKLLHDYKAKPHIMQAVCSVFSVCPWIFIDIAVFLMKIRFLLEIQLFSG